MPNVQGPDGKVISFPDSMSAADIDKAMAEAYGTAQPSSTPAALKWPAVAGTAVAQGLASGIGMFGDIPVLEHKAADYIGVPKVVSDVLFGLHGPTSDQTQAVTNSLGLTGTQIGRPETPAQRLVAGTIAGVTSALPMAATGDLPGVLAVGGMGGLGAAGASEALPNNPIVSTVAGIGTGLAGGSILGDVKNMLALRAATKAQSDASSALAAAKEAAFSGKEGIYQDSQARLKAAAAAANAAKASLTPHVPPYEQLAAQFGKTQTLQEAGEGMQDAGRKWLTDELPKRQAAAWAPADKLIPVGTEIELPEYAGALSTITSKGSRLGADLKSPLFDSLNRRLQGALRPSEDIPGEEATVKPLTWQDARELRSLIGDAMGDTATVKPIHQQDLGNLYRALTHDMGARASEISPQAAKAFNDANAASTKLFSFAEGPLANVIKGKKPDANDPNPEAVARRLVTAGRSGATDLAALRQEMPDAVNGLTAAFMRQQGASWHKLAPEAKLALAPTQTAQIEATLAKHEADAASFNLAHKTIASALADARAGAAASAHGSRVQLQSAQRVAQRNLDAANAKYQALKNSPYAFGGSMLGGIFGHDVGAELGVAALNALGLPGSDFLHSAWGGIAGAMAPWIMRSAAKVVTKPRLPLAATMGATGGAAATSLRGTQQ